jgi:hypothetical protein
MTLFALAAVLVLVATGSLVTAWRAGHHAAPLAATTHSQSPSPSASSRSASSAAASRPAVGSDAVAVAPAVAGEAHAQQVAALLTAYFGSINRRDYGGYSRLFIPQMRESVQHFDAGYQSTIDSGAALVGLTAVGAQGLAATVTFTSHQNPADSPNNAACDRWEVALWLIPNGTGYLITHSPAGYHAVVRACA